ncbi:MAG: RpiB/LacA/LacB family sugar-phosphate isomerase [Candidatus Woesearchaeota archaeon]
MIYLGSDHGGFKLKEKIKKFLLKKGFDLLDLGNNNFDDKDDYTDFAFKVAKKVSESDNPKMKWQNRDKGILFCRSSAGMTIAANKFKNVKAVSVFDVKSAKHSRLHNDSNVIAISGDWINEKKAKNIVLKWLNTEFSNEERHIRRLNKIKEIENKNFK